MRIFALIVLACGVEAHSQSLAAQVAAHVEAGFSDVKYDGFLASGAAALSPTMRWEDPRGRGFVSARGTYLHFESGRHSLDAAASGSWFTPLGGARHWRGELGLSAGASDYANIARFSHALVETRLHFMESERGGWIGTTFGRSSFGDGARPVAVVVMGMWLLRTNKTMFVSLDRSFIGDTAYSDLRSSGRWRKDRFVLEGIVGARFWSRGGGQGVYGEGSATLTVSPVAALVFSAGRYPTDVISGSIAGRYVALAVRLGTTTVPRRPATTLPAHPHSSGSSGPAAPGSPSSEIQLTIQKQQGDDVQLLLHAPGAATVEISGDFTDWQSVSLIRHQGKVDVWGGSFRISRGMHRVNVRRDGGAWVAPGGTTRSTDDFDGEVGVFTIP